MNAIALQTKKIIAEVEDGIGWLTFNHPERRNAISLEMWQGIGDALEAFEHCLNLGEERREPDQYTLRQAREQIRQLKGQ